MTKSTNKQPAKGQENNVKTESKLPAPNDEDQNQAAGAGAPAATGTVVALHSQKNQLPDELAGIMEMAEADAGKGMSAAVEDRIVPLVRILQTQSPEAVPANPQYIDGVTPGDIFIKSLGEIIDGDEGMIVQPCWFGHFWNEWVPRHKGGGFVAQHADLPEDVEEYVDDQDRKRLRRKSNKNEIVETRVHAVMFDGMACVIPFTSTGHTVSRTWTSLMDSFKLPSGKPQSAWLHRYRLRTIMRTNPAGSWYVFRVDHVGAIQTKGDYEAGKALYEAMSSGEKTIEAEQPDDDINGGGGGGQRDSEVM